MVQKLDFLGATEAAVAALSPPQERPALARALFHLLAAIGYLVLPPLLTYATAGTAAEDWFRPQPANPFYDAMLLAVCASITLTEILQFWLGRQRRAASDRLLQSSWEKPVVSAEVEEESTLAWLAQPQPPQDSPPRQRGDALVAFQVLLALLLGALCCAGGAFASGGVWWVMGTALGCLVTAASVPSHVAAAPAALGGGETAHTAPAAFRWTWELKLCRPPVEWAYSAFLCFVGVAALAAPVFQSWGGPAQPLLRWHPFTPAGELAWRGVFAAFAVSMIWAGVEDPLGKHIAFVHFLVISGAAHAGVMLAMNVRERVHHGLNGNPEHLYGDVLLFFLISACSAGACLFGGAARCVHRADSGSIAVLHETCIIPA